MEDKTLRTQLGKKGVYIKINEWKAKVRYLLENRSYKKQGCKRKLSFENDEM